MVDRWYGPDHRYVKLIAEDVATYILRHDEPNARWELTSYDVASG